MKIMQLFRSPTYWQFAIVLWLMSFLFISSSQGQNNFTYALIAIPMILTLRIKEVISFFSDPIAQGLLLVILTLAGASFIEGNPLDPLKFGALLILFYIAITRLPEISDTAAYKTAWVGILIITLYVLANMAWQYHLGRWAPGARLLNLFGKLENPIYVTDMMGCFLAVITLLGIRLHRYRTTILAHVLTFSITLGILQTRSILLLFASIAILTILSIFNGSHTISKKTKRLLLLGFFAAIVALALIVFLSPLGDKLLARNFYRPEIWQGFIAETMRCGMWFGCGPEHGFHYIAHDGYIMVNPHNIFIAQFYKAGIIGAIPLVFITLNGIYYGYRHRYWAGWFFIAGVSGLLVDGSSLVHSPNMRWLVFHLPLAFIVGHRIRRRSDLPQPDNSHIQAKPI